MMLLRSKDASNIASKVRDDETDLGTMSARVLMQALPSTSNYLFNSVGLWDKRFLWNFSSNAAEKGEEPRRESESQEKSTGEL
jgi:hypothetical protein